MKRFCILLLCLALVSAGLILPVQADYATLRKGSTGTSVRNMQNALYDLGYRLDRDGIYGSGTENVVRQFQRDQNLTADGIAGNKTLTRLYTLVSPGNKPTSVPTVAPTPTPVYGQNARIHTAGGNLNLRLSPSSSGRILTSIPNNTIVTALSASGSWTYVRYGSYTGYVMTSYLTFISATTPPPAPTATPKPVSTPTPSPTGSSARVITSGGSLNMRASATTSSRILTTIPNRSTVKVLQQGTEWCKISYKSYTGYVSSRYLEIIPVSPTVAPTASPVPTQPVISAIGNARVHTSGSTLNLRDAPGYSSAVIAQIPNSAFLPVYTYDGSWAYIFYNGKYGYASAAYLDYTPYTYPDPTAAPTQTPSADIPPYDTSIFTRTLRSGYTGQDVKLLQERLVELRYLTSVSGAYDTATITAVKLFQNVHGLDADGLAGELTFTQLFASNALPYTPSDASLTTLHIYYRNESSQDKTAITRMQNALLQLGYPLTVNGSFDEKTYAAVLEFELRNDIPVTGAATVQMQSLLYSGRAKSYSAPASITLSENEGRIAGPAFQDIQLLHWFNVVKPSLKSGDKLLVFDPNTHLSWTLLVYSCGNHCDSQPATLEDTLIMNKAFGIPSWTVHTVYVRLPNYTWTMATTHNRPHLTGSVTNNGFDGHLCVHFLRDLNEVKKNDPDYGLSNQLTLRSSWKTLTGIEVN